MERERSFTKIVGEYVNEEGQVIDEFKISKEDQAVIERLEKKYGYVRFVKDESKSLIASAEKKSEVGMEESDQSSEKRIDSLVKRATQLPENKGIAFLSDEYNRLQIKMKEVQTAFCRTFKEKELSPREIAQSSSEKFYIFVNNEYKQARRTYVESTSKKYQAIPVSGRFSGPRFTNASERLAKTINWSDNAVKSEKKVKKTESHKTSQTTERRIKVAQSKIKVLLDICLSTNKCDKECYNNILYRLMRATDSSIFESINAEVEKLLWG